MTSAYPDTAQSAEGILHAAPKRSIRYRSVPSRHDRFAFWRGLGMAGEKICETRKARHLDVFACLPAEQCLSNLINFHLVRSPTQGSPMFQVFRPKARRTP